MANLSFLGSFWNPAAGGKIMPGVQFQISGQSSCAHLRSCHRLLWRPVGGLDRLCVNNHDDSQPQPAQKFHTENEGETGPAVCGLRAGCTTFFKDSEFWRLIL